MKPIPVRVVAPSRQMMTPITFRSANEIPMPTKDKVVATAKNNCPQFKFFTIHSPLLVIIVHKKRIVNHKICYNSLVVGK